MSEVALCRRDLPSPFNQQFFQQSSLVSHYLLDMSINLRNTPQLFKVGSNLRPQFCRHENSTGRKPDTSNLFRLWCLFYLPYCIANEKRGYALDINAGNRLSTPQ